MSQLTTDSLQLTVPIVMPIQSYRDLHVWQKAFALVVKVYRVTDQLSKSEVYGLVSQMRRSAVSIPSNIAEGRQRKTRKDFVQFLHIADGSCAELETQLLLSKELFSVNVEEVLSHLKEVQRMLAGMIESLSSEKL